MRTRTTVLLTLTIGTLALAWMVLAPMVWARQEESTGSRLMPSGGGLVTMYAQDDSSFAFDFDTGRLLRPDRGRLDLSDAEFVFDRYVDGQLTFAHARRDKALVVDLGEEYVEPNRQPTDQALRVPLSIFYSIFLDRNRIKYVDGGGTLHHHRKGQEVLRQYPDSGAFHIEPVIGHTYLVRYQSGLNTSSNLVKLYIIDLEPGRWLTFRWAPMV